MSILHICLRISVLALPVHSARIQNEKLFGHKAMDLTNAWSYATKDFACQGCSDCRDEEDNTYFGRKEDLVFECFACPEGSALLKGPPAGFQPVGITVLVRTHCARMLDEERTVLMLRHGQSQWNVVMEDTKGSAFAVGMWHGWKDSPLSAFGLRQAQRLAQILHKADEKVYVPDEYEGYGGLAGAVTEMSYTNIEKLVRIVKNTSSEESEVSDEAAVAQLIKHPEALDVLLGRKCEDTSFVSSQLVRAMDTTLIATLPSRKRCAAAWEISSNLQEIEHNADCDARTEPHTNPVIESEQLKGYMANQMPQTLGYVSAMYELSDVSRFERNQYFTERLRLYDQTPQMAAEVQHLFNSPKKYTLWGGHSIWFRHFFKAFGDLADETCKTLSHAKIANTGIVSAQLREVEGSLQKYVATKCEYIYLGTVDEYKFKWDKSVATEALPTASDFVNDVKQIMGWKCCCSRADIEGENAAAQAWTNTVVDESAYAGKCLLVKTESCAKPSEWEEVQGEGEEAIADAKQYLTWDSAFLPSKSRCTAK